MRASTRLFLLATLMALTACVSTNVNGTSESYQKLCEYFRGASEETVMGYWGPPDKVKHGSNGKILRYNSITKTVIPGFTTYSQQQTRHSGTISNAKYGNATYSGTSTTSVPVYNPGYTETAFCFTSFFIDRTGRVADYRFEGPDCVAQEVL